MKCGKSIREVHPIGSQLGPACYSLKLITFQLTSINLYNTSYLILDVFGTCFHHKYDVW